MERYSLKEIQASYNDIHNISKWSKLGATVQLGYHDTDVTLYQILKDVERGTYRGVAYFIWHEDKPIGILTSYGDGVMDAGIYYELGDVSWDYLFKAISTFEYNGSPSIECVKVRVIADGEVNNLDALLHMGFKEVSVLTIDDGYKLYLLETSDPYKVFCDLRSSKSGREVDMKKNSELSNRDAKQWILCELADEEEDKPANGKQFIFSKIEKWGS